MKTYDPLLAALGEPTRRAILERLLGGPRAVVELARDLPVSRPAVSQHLKVLREARLVTHRVEGTRHVYRIDPRGLAQLRAFVEELWGRALASFKEAAEASGGTGGRGRRRR